MLHGWIAGTVLLLSRLAVGILALRVLIVAIGTLLRELVGRLLTGVASLLLLTVLPEVMSEEVSRNIQWSCDLPLLLLLVVVTVLANLLAMLEATLRWRTILRVVPLLVSISLLAVLLLRWLITLLLVAALVISTLLGVWTVSLGWVLLLLAVALVVLIVSRHVSCVWILGVNVG